MGAAASNRGTRLVSRDIDAAMPLAIVRSERQARKDEAQRLRDQVASLERDLARARRCIAELRRAKDEQASLHRADASRSAAAISILCGIAFPQDKEQR